MKSYLKRMVVLLALVAVAGCGCDRNYCGVGNSGFTPDRKQKKWEKNVFNITTERALAGGQKPVRDLNLTNDSEEIRIWVGFNAYPLKGIILRKEGSSSTAYYISPVQNYSDPEANIIELESPKSGWNRLWENLETLDLINLPDAEEIGMEDNYIDDVNIVVEVKNCAGYRTFRLFGFDIPGESSREPVQRMLKISNLLSEEFDVRLL
ncbi:MAG: hypothetical protein JSS81_16610 [Acidobacteria bacterium]|nr:hypothetical protein [Acidobacteriota bacterium]